MVGHGGSSAGSYLANPTSPIPSQCVSIVATSTVRVNIWKHVTCDEALDSSSGMIQCSIPHYWSCVEVSGKLFIPYCVCLPSSGGYLVEQES